jgi:hypothetical protein
MKVIICILFLITLSAAYDNGNITAFIDCAESCYQNNCTGDCEPIYDN